MLVHKQSAPQLSTGYHASGSSTTLDTHKTSLSSSSFMPEPCARMLRQATAKKIAKRPPLRLQPTQGSSGPRSAPPSSFNSPAQTIAPPMPMMTTHSSLFRSALMELRIDSPAAKVLRAHGSERPRSIPIFGDNDVVQGAVSLDTQLGSGRLVVTLEGAFVYSAPTTAGAFAQSARHVFFSVSTCPTSPLPDAATPRSASSLRGAFSGMRKRPSLTSLRSPASPNSSNVHKFTLELPRAGRGREELPPSFSHSHEIATGPRGRAGIERAEVAYRLLAQWHPSDVALAPGPTLEAPVLIQPESDWASLDGVSAASSPSEWLEVPLKSHRPLPFSCAVTLPNPASFQRAAGGGVPYFVVFTTTPRDSELAREIAVDATIAVSLVRVVTLSTDITPTGSPFSAPPLRLPRPRGDSLSNWIARPDSVATSLPPSPLVDESDSEPSKSKLFLHRVVRSGPPSARLRKASTSSPPVTPAANSRPGTPSFAQALNIPFPSTPATPAPAPVLDTRTIQTDVCVGFPKRPRHPGAQHPPLPGAGGSVGGLPDGLHKGKLQLARDMLPGMEWPGFRVKYYLDVSVLFEQDEVRARVPIKVY